MSTFGPRPRWAAISRLADQITRRAKAAGWRVSADKARETSSIYLMIEASTGLVEICTDVGGHPYRWPVTTSLRVRVADHEPSAQRVGQCDVYVGLERRTITEAWPVVRDAMLAEILPAPTEAPPGYALATAEDIAGWRLS